MILARKKHKLPKFPDTVIPTFEKLCVGLPPDRSGELHQELEAALKNFGELARNNPNFNLPLARKIAESCQYLVDHYAEYSSAHQAMVVGAVRYFIMPDDPLAEDTFASGFDDDARVVNYVLEQLGVEGKFLTVR